MKSTAIDVGSHFVERNKTTNALLSSKRNMSEWKKAEREFSTQGYRSQNQARYRYYYLIILIVCIFFSPLIFSGNAVSSPTQTGTIMIPGSMFSLKDGTEFSLALEYRFNNGIMTARNLKTGENFNGNYTAIFADEAVSTSTYRNVWGGNAGSATTTTKATRGTGKGILRGDKGTVISVTMEIKPTYNRNILPSGFGDGADNNGTRYQLQFGIGGTSVAATPPSDIQKSVSAPGIPAGVYQATRTYENGDKYTGEFVGGQFHGKGIYVYANGDQYEGEFINGKFTGKGTFTCSNGRLFTGMNENIVPLEYTNRCK